MKALESHRREAADPRPISATQPIVRLGQVANCGYLSATPEKCEIVVETDVELNVIDGNRALDKVVGCSLDHDSSGKLVLPREDMRSSVASPCDQIVQVTVAIRTTALGGKVAGHSIYATRAL